MISFRERNKMLLMKIQSQQNGKGNYIFFADLNSGYAYCFKLIEKIFGL
jgi:hypothetical protein